MAISKKRRPPPPPKPKQPVSDPSKNDETDDVSIVDIKSVPSNTSGRKRKIRAESKRNEAAPVKKTPRKKKSKTVNGDPEDDDVGFVGNPIEDSEARKRWPQRYEVTKAETNEKRSKAQRVEEDGRARFRRSSNKTMGNAEVLLARCHYLQARVDGCIYNLNDHVYVKGENEGSDFIASIVEFFETTGREPYFTARWFFKAEDTVIQTNSGLFDGKQVFISDLKDDNPLGCIISKIQILRVPPNVDLAGRKTIISQCNFYYNLKFSLPYSTFEKLPNEIRVGDETLSITSAGKSSDELLGKFDFDSKAPQKSKMFLLDLYAGCGGMSTGLCLGAKISGIDLMTRWAVDLNPHACESLRKNHPETEVRNETADSFLSLLNCWENLCKEFGLLEADPVKVQSSSPVDVEDPEDMNDGDDENGSDDFEVDHLLDICFGDPNEEGEPGLHFKVRWKGYDDPSEDTWEPYEGLSNCRERIRDFVTEGYRSKLLPLPGHVDVLCGGPPCQGISGFNRYRNKDEPLEDEKNRQLIVYMDIVKYLKPSYVLMENVVDILKFDEGSLGRYALGRLVAMDYQARLGMMVAGCYGLPQFRMRVFLWGAYTNKVLPQFPLPSHEVDVRGLTPKEFEQNLVAYDEDKTLKLGNALNLSDAISELPEITNYETEEERPYGSAPLTKYQENIRLCKHGHLPSEDTMLYDHFPFKMKEDDYKRVCLIPKEKGANFRNLPGVKVVNNKVQLDDTVKREYLPSGKPLVPNYALRFNKGTSTEPFGRVWWDEIIPTVVTRPEPHNRTILHPTQDRVLSVREIARLQGFPDYYRLYGPIKERYMQVGNAVAVPVARALGYSMGLAYQGLADEKPVFTLPPNFPNLGGPPLPCTLDH